MSKDLRSGSADLLVKAMRRVFKEEVEPTLEAEASPPGVPSASGQDPESEEDRDRAGGAE